MGNSENNFNYQQGWVNFCKLSSRDLNKIAAIRFINDRETRVTKPIEILGNMLYQLHALNHENFFAICKKCRVNTENGIRFAHNLDLYLNPNLGLDKIWNCIFIIIAETQFSLHVQLKGDNLSLEIQGSLF